MTAAAVRDGRRATTRRPVVAAQFDALHARLRLVTEANRTVRAVHVATAEVEGRATVADLRPHLHALGFEPWAHIGQATHRRETVMVFPSTDGPTVDAAPLSALDVPVEATVADGQQAFSTVAAVHQPDGRYTLMRTQSPRRADSWAHGVPVLTNRVDLPELVVCDVSVGQVAAVAADKLGARLWGPAREWLIDELDLGPATQVVQPTAGAPAVVLAPRSARVRRAVTFSAHNIEGWRPPSAIRVGLAVNARDGLVRAWLRTVGYEGTWAVIATVDHGQLRTRRDDLGPAAVIACPPNGDLWAWIRRWANVLAERLSIELGEPQSLIITNRENGAMIESGITHGNLGRSLWWRAEGVGSSSWEQTVCPWRGLDGPAPN